MTQQVNEQAEEVPSGIWYFKLPPDGKRLLERIQRQLVEQRRAQIRDARKMGKILKAELVGICNFFLKIDGPGDYPVFRWRLDGDPPLEAYFIINRVNEVDGILEIMQVDPEFMPELAPILTPEEYIAELPVEGWLAKLGLPVTD